MRARGRFPRACGRDRDSCSVLCEPLRQSEHAHWRGGWVQHPGRSRSQLPRAHSTRRAFSQAAIICVARPAGPGATAAARSDRTLVDQRKLCSNQRKCEAVDTQIAPLLLAPLRSSSWFRRAKARIHAVRTTRSNNDYDDGRCR